MTSSENLAKAWSELSKGLDKIYSNTEVLNIKEYMTLFSRVFNYCSTSSSDHDENQSGLDRGRRDRRNASHSPSSVEFIGGELYKKIVVFLEEYVNSLYEPCLSLSGIKLLEHYNSLWTTFRLNSITADGIFSYLNRHWIRLIRREIDENNTSVYEIYNLAIHCWHIKLFVRIAEALTDAILKLILNERKGQTIPTSLISGVLNSYRVMGINEPDNSSTPISLVFFPTYAGNRKSRALNIFKNYFETKFIEQTKIFYSIEMNDFSSSIDAMEYLELAVECFKKERGRVDRYLGQSTLNPLMKACDDIFIEKYLDRFRDAFKNILGNNQKDDLVRIFSVCRRIDEASQNVSAISEALSKIFQTYIEREGRIYIENATSETAECNSNNYINAILDVHKHFSSLLATEFKKGHPFFQAMDKAHVNFINYNNVTVRHKTLTPEFLARYVDLLLRKNAKKSNEEEIDNALTQAMIVFNYIEDKDLFQKFYSKLMAKRLVYRLSNREDNELIMLQKLKEVCGFEYTTKFHQMFNDIMLSKEVSQSFKEDVNKKKIDLNNIDLSVCVLTYSIWPFKNSEYCKIPLVIENVIKKFTTFYLDKHNGRKLTFLPHLSHGEIIFNVFERKYCFLATAGQIAMILLYNDKLQYTLQELNEALEFKSDEFWIVLQSMVKIELLSSNDGRKCFDTSTPMDTIISLNSKFSSKKFKIDLTKSNNQTKAHKEDVPRIMKMRKKCTHTALMAEVIQQLSARFKPNVNLIKKCVGTLIEKDYFARNKDDCDTYEYLS